MAFRWPVQALSGSLVADNLAWFAQSSRKMKAPKGSDLLESQISSIEGSGNC